jgi:hypothetical protein
MRTIEIGSFTVGIQRQRTKAGASPDSLYDLVNGYVDQSGAAVGRDGTSLFAALPPGTAGMCTFQSIIHVFALTAVAVPSNVICNILIHPDPDFTGTITFIHFAKPFLGYLYVVAEFSDGTIAHYWLQGVIPWTADTMFQLNAFVRPIVKTGYVYKATTTDNPTAWAPSTITAVGAEVQPTTANGFKYVCIEVDGENPITGTTEPAWPTSAGATVNDDNDNGSAGPTSPLDPGSSGSPAGPRYDNYPGSATP